MTFEKIKTNALEKPNNVFELETSKANYDIIYNVHNVPIDPECIKNADALILEALISSNQQKIEKSFQDFSPGKNWNECYDKIIPEAIKLKKPIFLVDMSEEKEFAIKLSHIIRSILHWPETVAGLSLVSSGIKDLRKKDLSRRDFIKIGSKFIGGLYLSIPGANVVSAIPSLFDHLDEKSLSRKAEKKLARIQKTTHPELSSLAIETRNDLIAQKSEVVAEILGRELGKKPNIALAIGGAHSMIEDSLLADSKKRVENLRRDLGDDLKKEKTIVRIDFGQINKEGKQELKITLLEDPALD